MGKDRRDIATRLIHPLERSSRNFHSLVTPIERASTVLFDSLADALETGRESEEHYRYGVNGTPTTRELELRFAEIEEAAGCALTPSGLAAIALTYLATCKAGDHVLIPASVYLPNTLIGNWLKRMEIEVEHYDPMIGGGIAALLRPNTRLIWCESPGSISMEVQDVPAIVAATHANGTLVAVDNTYASGLLFNPLAHGADLSVHALTKYPGGHSDVLMGAINSRDEALARKVRDTARLLGICVSSDEAALVLRGLPTMRLRLDHIGKVALEMARWFADMDEVETVLHPALPACPGHTVFQRDFSGGAGVFSIIFKDWERERVARFVNALELFKIGYSWGGVVSLVMAYDRLERPSRGEGERLVRFNIGLEDANDLKADIVQAMERA
ncbi:cystathionine beta-lyase [Sphingomicrobium flavum]|uniref:cystathionine beta-lyase n=1 Tax=Sphingomicrobium flavum TaxID=1229164 RepID=UPI0021ADBE47|nr:cystathionine beta-lyase [Sphingomicrobium flavum]